MSLATRSLERTAEALCADVAALNHGFWSGIDRGGGDARAIYRRRRRLFSRSAIGLLREIAERARGGGGESDEVRRARQLLGFAVESRVLAARLRCDARAAVNEATAVVRAEGRSIPMSRLRSALAAERDPAARRALGQAADRIVVERLDPHLAEARDLEAEALAAVGFRSRREVVELCDGFSLTDLAAGGEAFLRSTEAEYLELRDERALELGLNPAELDAADLPAMTERRREDRRAAEELREGYEARARALGLDPLAGGRISLDLEPRAGKAERSFCTPVAVPGDVRVVVGCDESGRADLASLLHEAGHAQHRAWTDPGLDFPARLLGDSSVGESWAFLFEGLATEEGGQDRFGELLLTRRYCAVLMEELATEAGWGREAEATGRQRFADSLSAATGARWSGARRLRAPDPGYYAARYLRGWMLAALWRRDLGARFGPGWAQRPEAGERLRSLWSWGQRRDAHHLAVEEAGAGGLGFDALEPAALSPLAGG